MKHTRLAVLTGMLLAAMVMSGTFGGGEAADAAASSRVDVIIGFRSAPGPAERALVEDLGGSVRATFRVVPAVTASLSEGALGALRSDARVASVELDGEVHALHLADTDTLAEVTNSWGVDRLDANLVTTAGAGVGVAIVDTGSGPHPDLPAAAARKNCLSGSCVDGGDDDNGHGTHVAGSVLAVQNSVGVVGVSHGATLFSYKVLNASGSGSWSGIIAALDDIVAYNATSPAVRIAVANFSLGSSSDPGATVKAAFDNTYASGVLVIAAAGNSGNPRGKGNNVGYPARYSSVVAVAATDKSDKRATFSSTGPDVGLAAPGVSINSTYLDGGYKVLSGTSMATPHVTGAAALVIGAGAVTDTSGVNGIADEVRALLNSTAKDLGSAGRDSSFGYGLVNPEKAVTGANTHSPY